MTTLTGQAQVPASNLLPDLGEQPIQAPQAGRDALAAQLAALQQQRTQLMSQMGGQGGMGGLMGRSSYGGGFQLPQQMASYSPTAQAKADAEAKYGVDPAGARDALKAGAPPKFDWTSPYSYFYNGPTRGKGSDYRTFVRDYALADREELTNKKGDAWTPGLRPFEEAQRGSTEATGLEDAWSLPNLGWFDEQGNIKAGFEGAVKRNESEYYNNGVGNAYDDYYERQAARARRLDRGD